MKIAAVAGAVAVILVLLGALGAAHRESGDRSANPVGTQPGRGEKLAGSSSRPVEVAISDARSQTVAETTPTDDRAAPQPQSPQDGVDREPVVAPAPRPAFHAGHTGYLYHRTGGGCRATERNPRFNWLEIRYFETAQQARGAGLERCFECVR